MKHLMSYKKNTAVVLSFERGLNARKRFAQMPLVVITKKMIKTTNNINIP
jgi:hypothetical protein